jgi:hypothetical protein
MSFFINTINSTLKKRNRKKNKIWLTFRIKFSKIASSRTVFYLACRFDWFSARNSWTAQQSRFHEFFRTERRSWRSFIRFFNRWLRLWRTSFCNSLILLSRRTSLYNSISRSVRSRESFIAFCNAESRHVFFFWSCKLIYREELVCFWKNLS